MGAVDTIEWACVLCTVWPSHSKWLSELSNESASSFALSLNILPRKLFWWSRGQLVIAASSQSCACLLMHHVLYSLLLKHQITQVTQTPCSTDLVLHDFWLFPKLKNYFWKGRDFRPSVRFRKICWGSWWWLGEPYEVPRCLLWRGLRSHCPMYNVSCILHLLQ